MTIEATNADASYTFRVNEDDGCCLDRRENKDNARWVRCYLCYDTPETARRQMLRLSRKEKAE